MRPTTRKGAHVLGEHPIDVVLLATDLKSSKEFYADKLGLEILNENEEEITYKCGGDSRLSVTKSTTGTADEQTQAGWRVPDLPAEPLSCGLAASRPRSTTCRG
jgi:catechol 2,3-dioxygenase-like lactoylglutathione lyase family enzyme